MSNIWTAASEGDFAQVKLLIESGLSPNVADENSYTPIHAAASWGHIEILNYLILEKGGDINILDADGETPLFLVESAQMARIIVALGGNPGKRNLEGMSPAQSLQDDYPHISLYLRTLTGEPTPALSSNSNSMDVDNDSSSSSPPANSTFNVVIPTDQDLDESTDSLLYRVKLIMEASERGEFTSEETDEKLREVVEQVVRGQIEEGKKIGEGLDGGVAGGIREREEVEGEAEVEADLEGEGKGKRRRDEGAR